MQFAALGLVALFVFGMTFLSGRKAQRPVDVKSMPGGPSQAQVEAFRRILEKQRVEVDDLTQKLQKMLNTDAPPGAVAPHVAAPELPDELERAKRAKAAAAPFARSVVLRAEEKEQSRARASSQVVLRTDEEEEQTEEAVEPAGSGQFLPSKVGGLHRLFEGTTIHTALVNQLEGSFTGPVKCVVREDVRSKDGSALLIPKGAIFLGEAVRVEAQNQTRLAVTFKRLLLPNDYSIELKAAPGLDRAGETGLKDKVNNHRFRTFGLSGAIGLLGGLALYAGQGSPFAAGVGNTMGYAATNALGHYLNAVPTITIRQGHPVVVYLPNDILLPEYRP